MFYIVDIEMLWKKRFHLLDSPLQKMKYFLSQKREWCTVASSEIGTVRYYKYMPEYTIKVSELEGDAVETFMLTQMDAHGAWHNIFLYYHQTMLYQTIGVSLDGSQFLTVNPTTGSLDYQNITIFYHYLCRDSIKFTLYEFFTNDENSREYQIGRAHV